VHVPWWQSLKSLLLVVEDSDLISASRYEGMMQDHDACLLDIEQQPAMHE
jgi:hypothetical protein